MRRPSHSLALLMLLGLAACAGKKTLPGDDQPTLKSMSGREITVAEDNGVKADENQAIAAYTEFLKAAPKATQRAEAMRRLGDLEMDGADNRLAAGQQTPNGTPDYKAATARYQEFLKTYPQDDSNDRVLYQLARAQEQGGDLELALKTLDELVAKYPKTIYRDEAQFRRGELLFSTRDYVKAEVAYATVLQGDSSNPFRDRALYMQGWSLFKQGRLDDALHPFFGVLDLKLGGRKDEGELETMPGLTRGDRELVEDTFRVASLSLENLQGAESIPAYMTTPERRSYEWRVYQQLGELYLRQDRPKDAADTFSAFARRDPLHGQSPLMQARVIAIYQQNGFGAMALDAKKEYVERYGVDSEFSRQNSAAWQENAQPLVKTNLAELAQHYHSQAQKSKSTADYQEAVKWYRSYLTSFPKDPEAPQNNFLLAELLYEDGRFKEAAPEYEKTAYGYPLHAKSADAGYAALLSYAAQEKKATPAELPALQKESVESALRFANANPADKRSGPVLTNAAEKLFTLGDQARAATVARQVLALQPPAEPANRRVAWTVIAHSSFERGDYEQAEQAYGEVLALAPEKDPARKDLVERQAASIYKQGEQARSKGQLVEAVKHFSRVGTVAPQSSVAAPAQYDAAAAMIGLKDWDGASRTLEDFRKRYPNHPLQADVGSKLALAYTERGQWALAAGEYERFAVTNKDPALARDALWQSAEMYEKAGSRANAGKAYERYLKQGGMSFEASVEARYRLAKIAKDDGNAAREFTWMKEIYQVDQAGGAARTNRTRYLGATAALAMAAPVADSYRKVQLVEPLAAALKNKKARLEESLKAYAVAADYGVADVTTAATYQIASLYQDFGKALVNSQRPKKLSKLELEQYNVMLEEQAYPFEEKATELHELNARRTTNGIYDQWVKSSFKALGEIRPLRYGKTERSEGVVDAIR